MKAGIMTALIALCLPVTVLPPLCVCRVKLIFWCWMEKKKSPAHYCVADSIELENGRHQLVFRVENPSPVQPRRTSVYFLRWLSALIPSSSAS